MYVVHRSIYSIIYYSTADFPFFRLSKDSTPRIEGRECSAMAGVVRDIRDRRGREGMLGRLLQIRGAIPGEQLNRYHDGRGRDAVAEQSNCS